MIKITMQEVLHDAIQQIEHLQDSITDLTQEPMLRSTKGTIHLMEDAINSNAALSTVEVNESNYQAPVVTKQELITRLYNLVNAIDASSSRDQTVLPEDVILALKDADETLKKVRK